MAWWRAYDEALDDPKIQRLDGETFKTWFNILCLAKRNDGYLPSVSDIAFALRLPEKIATQRVETLRKAGLLDGEDGTLRPHNWDGRQFQSDSSTARVKQFRDRQRNGHGNVSHDETKRFRNGHGNGTELLQETATKRHATLRETAPDTEADSEQKERGLPRSL